jgi:WD40 repeat protein
VLRHSPTITKAAPKRLKKDKKQNQGQGDEMKMKMTPLQTLLGHTGRVWQCSWNPKGTLLATCGEDTNIREGGGRQMFYNLTVHLQ